VALTGSESILFLAFGAAVGLVTPGCASCDEPNAPPPPRGTTPSEPKPTSLVKPFKMGQLPFMRLPQIHVSRDVQGASEGGLEDEPADAGLGDEQGPED
jgi:hypothetical protein